VGHMNWWDSNMGPVLSRPDVAGMLGSLLGSFLGTLPGVTRLQRACSAAGGMVIAYYLGPLTADVLGITNPRGQTAIGFLVGMLGLAVLVQISTSLKSVDWRGHIDGFLDRILGSKKI
jgi:hypothetical protein